MGEVRKIELWGVPGNHGRSGPYKRDANPDSVNWDTVASKMWVARMGPKVDGDRLTVHVAEDDFIQVVPVGNHRILNLHGHQFSGTGGMAGIPVYSIATSIAKWTSSGAYEFDSMFFGHFHVPTTGMFGKYQWYLNGSLQTGSQFVRDVVKQKSRPAQRLVIFDPDHGPIADHVIWLDN